MGKGRKTKKILNEIVEWISEGKTLREFCRRNSLSPTTVYSWINKDDDFCERIARARDIGADVIAEEILEIIDDASNDYMVRDLGEGIEVEVLDREHIQRSKLRAEMRLKLLAKWNPKKYGDKLDLNHSGNVQMDTVIHEARKRAKK